MTFYVVAVAQGVFLLACGYLIRVYHEHEVRKIERPGFIPIDAADPDDWFAS